jgi:hypothetical protein
VLEGRRCSYDLERIAAFKPALILATKNYNVV